MILYVCRARHRYTLDRFLPAVPAERRGMLGVLTYEDMFATLRIPPANLIFTDFDRLSQYELEIAASAADQMRRACREARILSHPARFLQRHELLTLLWHRGINPFRSARLELPLPDLGEAVSELLDAGVPVTAVVSDLPSVGQLGYVSLDNRAAGRTAGYMMELLCRDPGHVAVVWGGLLSRAHEERESGFRSLLRNDRPDLVTLDVNSGNDSPDENRKLVRNLLLEVPDIRGIYCVGAGPSAIVDAIADAGRSGEVMLIAHNLTTITRAHLLANQIALLIHQDMFEIARAAIRNLMSDDTSRRVTVATHVITRENLQHHLDLSPIQDLLQ